MKENLDLIGYYVGLGVSVFIAYMTYGRKQSKVLIKSQEENRILKKNIFKVKTGINK